MMQTGDLERMVHARRDATLGALSDRLAGAGLPSEIEPQVRAALVLVFGAVETAVRSWIARPPIADDEAESLARALDDVMSSEIEQAIGEFTGWQRDVIARSRAALMGWNAARKVQTVRPTAEQAALLADKRPDTDHFEREELPDGSFTIHYTVPADRRREK